MKPVMISFMGLDGSGKSTSIKMAEEYMSSADMSVEIVRAAYVVEYLRPFLEFGKKLLLKGNSDPYGGDYRSYLEEMRKKTETGTVFNVYQALTNAEFRLQIRNRIVAKQRRGTNLLVDRYIYDNVVTYAANTGKGREFMLDRLNTTWRKAPKPDLSIYIDTPVDVCMSRKDDVPDPLYLEVRKPLYDIIAEELGAVVISGSQPMEDMRAELVSAIDEAIRKKNPNG